ncbi:MAG: sulfite exporter TauE/SafE family protein [Pseudomonadota bacterium]
MTSIEPLVSQLPVLAAAGIVAGLLAGLLGIGGGIVLVPAGLIVLGALQVPASVSMHVAIATSSAAIVFSAMSSALAHHRLGSVDWVTVQRWALWTAAGAFAGGVISRYINGDWLRLLFMLLAVFVGFRFLRPTDHQPTAARALPLVAQRGIATLIGLFSAWLGIGGGSFTVPVLTTLGTAVSRAIATSAALGNCIALPATLGFIIAGLDAAGRPPLSIGYVHTPSLVVFALSAMALAPVGARLAHRINQRRLKQLFGVFLWIAALRIATGLMANTS